MINIITSVSRFTMILMFAVYTYDCFAVLRSNISEGRKKRMFHKQTLLMYLILANGNLVLFLNTLDFQILTYCAMEILFFMVAMAIYKKVYEGASYALVNNMCMLLAISFIMLSRLDFSKAIKQFVIAMAALLITCFVPVMIERLKVWDRLTWLYAIIGIGALGAVTLVGNRTFGANLSLTIGGISIQPSEIVKIVFVFYIASMVYMLPKDDRNPILFNVHSNDFKQIAKTGIIAALHVLILVAARDLGSATVFLLTFLAMIYVATRKPTYLILGTGTFALMAVVGYLLFGHVRQRVVAWKDPLAVIDGDGYQISQSLFAIGTGGWFGSGLTKGMPNKIPVVTKDFIFSAISEEMGGFFALCLILVCISCFLMFLKISMEITDQFYKLIALGLGVSYGVQVFLTLGGVTKYIPSTGVTLPLVSYGGSSLLATIFSFAIIQGLYCRKNYEEELEEYDEYE